MKDHQRPVPKPLGHHTEALPPANQPWQKAVAGRESVADATTNRGKLPRNNLEDSLQLQKQLRQLTHQVLAAQEDQRVKISHELRDEIAQSLLGINVRLLLLKQAARSKARGLKKEIASAQRLVAELLELVWQLARELDHHQPTPSELTVMAI